MRSGAWGQAIRHWWYLGSKPIQKTTRTSKTLGIDFHHQPLRKKHEKKAPGDSIRDLLESPLVGQTRHLDILSLWRGQVNSPSQGTAIAGGWGTHQPTWKILKNDPSHWIHKTRSGSGRIGVKRIPVHLCISFEWRIVSALLRFNSAVGGRLRVKQILEAKKNLLEFCCGRGYSWVQEAFFSDALND